MQRSFSLRVGGSKDDKDESFAKKYRILPTPIKIRPSKVFISRKKDPDSIGVVLVPAFQNILMGRREWGRGKKGRGEE